MQTRSLDPLLAAKRRGAERRKAMINEAGGALTVGEAAKQLNATPELVAEVIRAERLLSVPIAGVPMIPVFQTCHGSVLSGLPVAIEALEVGDAWMRLNFILVLHPELGGRRAIEALIEGDIGPVLSAAAGFGRQ